jgi:hypothetical protein
MTKNINLPTEQSADSAAGTKLFFDTYGQQPLEFAANDISAAKAFFQSRGFDGDAATLTAIVLLKQAKLDNIPVFKIIDTLKTFNGVQISAIVAEILNNNRSATSTLGYKLLNVEKQNQTRNILA